jgi:transposase InsO family protein
VPSRRCHSSGLLRLEAPAAEQTREQARLRVFWYIECFYNPRRRHSSLGMLSPIDYEHQHQQEAIAA